MSPRRLWSIPGNTQRLDGGAMFGNAPRAVWERWIAPDPAYTWWLHAQAIDQPHFDPDGYASRPRHATIRARRSMGPRALA